MTVNDLLLLMAPTIVLFSWLILTRQRDILETSETQALIMAGTFLVLFQLAYCTVMAASLSLLYWPVLSTLAWDITTWGARRWGMVISAITIPILYLIPLLFSIHWVTRYASTLHRRWRLRRVLDDHACQRLINEARLRLGSSKEVNAFWAVRQLAWPFTFQAPFQSATLVIPLSWAIPVARTEQNEAARDAMQRFVLLHELAHVRNGDVFFMTWAGVFLQGYRRWGPIIVAAPLATLFGLSDYLFPRLAYSAVQTVIIYFLLRFLYLAVSRQRELLADARAALHLTDKQVNLVLETDGVFVKKSEHRPLGTGTPRTYWRVLGRYFRSAVGIGDSDPVPSLGVTAFQLSYERPTGGLSTHPSPDSRRIALSERSAIQSRVSAISTGVAGWIGLITGVYLSFLLVPLMIWIPMESLGSTLATLPVLLFPTAALCLPLRNALSDHESLRQQLGIFLWRSIQVVLFSMVPVIMGFVFMRFVFHHAGLPPISIQVYAPMVLVPLMLIVVLTLTTLMLMRGLYRSMEGQPRVAWLWLGIITLLTVGLLLVLLRVNSVDVLTLDELMFRLLLSLIAIVICFRVFQYFFYHSVDFELLFSCLRWAGPQPRTWRRASSSASLFLTRASVEVMVLLIAVILVPGLLTGYLLSRLNVVLLFSFDNLDNTLLSVAALAVTILVCVAAILPSHRSPWPGQAWARGPAMMLDAARLGDLEMIFGLTPPGVPTRWLRSFPREILSSMRVSSDTFWRESVLTIETLSWAVRALTWLFSSKVLSIHIPDYIVACSGPRGGFGLWPCAMASLRATHHALVAAERAGMLGRIVPDLHASWIASCVEPEGGYCSPEHRSASLKDTRDAIVSLARLGRLDMVDRVRCAGWVQKAWYSSDQGLEPTALAFTCLRELDAVTSDLVSWLEHNWLPRYLPITLSLRVDKQSEDVLNYVQTVAHLYEPGTPSFMHWTEGLPQNVDKGIAAFLGTADKRR